MWLVQFISMTSSIDAVITFEVLWMRSYLRMVAHRRRWKERMLDSSLFVRVRHWGEVCCIRLVERYIVVWCRVGAGVYQWLSARCRRHLSWAPADRRSAALSCQYPSSFTYLLTMCRRFPFSAACTPMPYEWRLQHGLSSVMRLFPGVWVLAIAHYDVNRMTLAQWGLKIGVIGQGQGQCKVCVQHDCLLRAASYECWLMVVVVSFRCDVISCELAQRGVRYGVWRDRGQRQLGSAAHVVTHSVWPRSFIEGSFSSIRWGSSRLFKVDNNRVDDVALRLNPPRLCRAADRLISHEISSSSLSLSMCLPDRLHLAVVLVGRRRQSVEKSPWTAPSMPARLRPMDGDRTVSRDYWMYCVTVRRRLSL